jgi:sec-independent protein translocase protein TatA
MPFNVGGPEIIIILIIALIVLGPKRLPDVGRSLGNGLREFKDSISGADPRRTDDDDDEGYALR